jgi:hypothetical protein
VEKYGRARQATDDKIIRRTCFACSIDKATYTHSEYLIHTGVPLQQWLRERFCLLRYTYIACLVNIYYFGKVFQLSGPEKVVRGFNRNVGVSYVGT